MQQLFKRAQFADEHYLIEKFLVGLLNETLRAELIMRHSKAQTYETMRVLVILSHAAIIQMIRMGKRATAFNLTRLTQLCDASSLATYSYWKKRNKGNANQGKAMDMSHFQDPTWEENDMLFFMGVGDLEVRDHETKEDLVYWEADIDDQTLGAMLKGRTDLKDKACFHCNIMGHLKAHCPQRHKTPGQSQCAYPVSTSGEPPTKGRTEVQEGEERPPTTDKEDMEETKGPTPSPQECKSPELDGTSDDPLIGLIQEKDSMDF